MSKARNTFATSSVNFDFDKLVAGVRGVSDSLESGNDHILPSSLYACHVLAMPPVVAKVDGLE